MRDCDTELFDAFHLEDINSKRLGGLSGGTRQKVSACLAFLFHPEMLILDEPTAGLDVVSSELLKEKIKAERKKGKLILISSHVLSDFDELVDSVIYMQEGKIVFRSTTDSLKKQTGEHQLSKAIASTMGYSEND